MATCSTFRDRTSPPATPAIAASTTSAPSASVESAAPPIPTEMPTVVSDPTASPSPEGVPAELPRGAGHELDGFYAALRSLEKHTRSTMGAALGAAPSSAPKPPPTMGAALGAAPSHVRVAWLGDSHGAADLWSGPLRAALQARFGDGGPGFVHVGYKASRHEQVRVELKGRWAVLPRQPATGARTGDGVFGLGGVLLAGSEDGPRATLTVSNPALPAALTWDLCYKLSSPRDELELGVTGLPDRVLKADTVNGEALGVLRHVTFTSTSPAPALRVVPLGGQPGLCGVTVETDPRVQPGVVLDTLGINGARLITPLAWDEAAWVAELSRRPPSLVIVEYGTNEASDHIVHPEGYVENLRRLMARVHAAAPESDCLVLAPTDRADTLERMPLVRDALRTAAQVAGCGFWDTYEVMGGKGSILVWRNETPPRAGPDGVHLTVLGYRTLGDRLARDVLAGYKG